MGRFIFHDEITVDFGDGIIFAVPDDKQFVTVTLQEINADFQKAVGSHPQDDRAVLNDTLDAIDKILGEGATGRIFKGHKLSPNNVVGAYFFIVNEILSQYTQYEREIKEMQGKYNSAQQRTAVSINDEAKAIAEQKLAELGISPSSISSSAEAALRTNELRPRL